MTWKDRSQNMSQKNGSPLVPRWEERNQEGIQRNLCVGYTQVLLFIVNKRYNNKEQN